MNRIGRFTDGQTFTAGEKALVVMVAAGVFGYWAGFKLSTPGDVVGTPVIATAAALPVAGSSSPSANADVRSSPLAGRVGAQRGGAVAHDDPAISKF